MAIDVQNLQDLNQDSDARELLKATVCGDVTRMTAAKQELAQTLALSVFPLKKGVLLGDTVGGIFSFDRFEPGQPVEYPTDMLVPGTEGRYVAYVVPKTGKPAQKFVDSDYIMVKTFEVATGINWSRKYAQYARWDVVGRAMAIGEAGFTKKRNNDGWHVLLSGAVDRGLVIYDNLATSGYFSKRLIALAQTEMRRHSGGNSSSVDNGRLTHVAMSPEGLQDIRSWDATQLDEVTRREIYVADGEIMYTKIFGVVLMDIDEFGENQEYNSYFDNTLSGTFPGSPAKVEFAMGLDLRKGLQDSFVMPYVVQPNGQETEIFEDPNLMLTNRAGYFWRRTWGAACMDNRRVLGLAF